LVDSGFVFLTHKLVCKLSDFVHVLVPVVYVLQKGLGNMLVIRAGGAVGVEIFLHYPFVFLFGKIVFSDNIDLCRKDIAQYHRLAHKLGKILGHRLLLAEIKPLEFEKMLRDIVLSAVVGMNAVVVVKSFGLKKLRQIAVNVAKGIRALLCKLSAKFRIACHKSISTLQRLCGRILIFGVGCRSAKDYLCACLFKGIAKSRQIHHKSFIHPNKVKKTLFGLLGLQKPSCRIVYAKHNNGVGGLVNKGVFFKKSQLRRGSATCNAAIIYAHLGISEIVTVKRRDKTFVIKCCSQTVAHKANAGTIGKSCQFLFLRKLQRSSCKLFFKKTRFFVFSARRNTPAHVV